MPTNILRAINNLCKFKKSNLKEAYRSVIRINQTGDSLEYFVKDIFCGSLLENDLQKKEQEYSKNFSYGGNAKNPPDVIIKKGDAIEIKKLEGLRGSVALNSSYPKAKLCSNSPLITRACRECEEWTEKDIIYSVGILNKTQIKILWFVYGDCYAADKDVYESIKDNMTKGVRQLPDVDFSETTEIARIRKVDPLGITDLRVRGMWHIANPFLVYGHLVNWKKDGKFYSFTIMRKEKYMSFSEADRKKLTQNKNLSVSNIKIKNPNNTAQMIDSVLITVKF